MPTHIWVLMVLATHVSDLIVIDSVNQFKLTKIVSSITYLPQSGSKILELNLLRANTR